MTDETPRAGDLCPECGTPIEVTEVTEESDGGEGATLVLRCANGHVRTVHRHHESGEESSEA